MGVMIQNGGEILWRGHLRMRGDSSLLRVSKASLPTGISQVTLYRADGTAVSERLVFANNHDALHIQITSPEKTFRPRAKVDMNLKVTDPQGNPVQGSFSLSVTDGSQVQDTARYGDNLLTHLLLSSEVRGRIEDPGYYFEADTQEKRQALEVLLLTQGWRRYLWDLAQSDTLPQMKYPVDRGIPISGTIRNITTRQPVKDHEVTLLLQHKEGMDAAVYNTDETGHFKFVTDYFGEGKVNIQTKYTTRRNKTLHIERAIDLDKNELSFNSDAEGLSVLRENNSPQGGLDKSLQLAQAAIEDYQQAQEEVKDYFMRMDSVASVIHLNTVEVKTKAVWKPSNHLTSVADTTIMIREAMETMRDYVNYGAYGIQEFLLYAYPEKFKLYAAAGNETVMYVGRRPLLFLVDTWPVDDPGDISCYSKVEIIEKPGVALIYASDYELLSDDILKMVIIALTQNPDAMCRNIPLGVRSYRMQGYAQAKEFFSPDYAKENPATPDARSTLFWAPHVQTDSTGRASVSFYNSDQATGLSVNVQGMATSGTTGAGATREEFGTARGGAEKGDATEKRTPAHREP